MKAQGTIKFDQTDLKKELIIENSNVTIGLSTRLDIFQKNL